jgi:phospholipid/cholesterol/gamma-HCH transport system substrate-binding protein
MSSAARVGAFMLVILVILGYFILKIEDVSFGRGKEGRTVTVDFDNVAGLDEKSAVRIAGVRKGKVDKIEVLPNGKARVTLKIEDDVPLHANAIARVANLGLLGEKYIELDPGTAAAPVVQGDTIQLAQPGGSTASIDDVTNQVSAIAKDIKAITESMRAVTAGPAGQQRLEDIVENVRLITIQVRELINSNQANLNATVANARAVSAELRESIPRLADSIDKVANSISGTVGENRQDVRVIAENLKKLSGDLKTTSENLNSITSQVRTGEGTVGRLLYSGEAHDRLTTALTAVESGVNELKNTLSRVTRMTLDLGMKADYYAGLPEKQQGLDKVGGNTRAAVMLNLTPNPERNRFYHVELADDPYGNRRDKTTQLTTIDPSGHSSTTTVIESRFERGFLVSAQAGWSLAPFAVRLGLFDSSGGAGVDWRYNDRIRLTGEAFDFGGRRDDNPHLRVYGEYIMRREKPRTPLLFISSGVDNPLNKTAFTFGGGIRWRDDDLKYLLGTLPIK